jgi:fermentation-respiration switch protein FrsA (DUF1100 family)
MMLLLAGCMTLDGFFFANEPLDAYTLGGDVVPLENQELVTFESGDGTRLYGVWAHQPDPTDAPVFLYFHGNSKHIDEYWERVELYWQYGFETFIFDYRGFGMSDGEPTFDGVIADGAAAIRYVTDTTGLESTELHFDGLSLGGFVSMHNVARFPPKTYITESMFATVQRMLDDATLLDMPAGWYLEENWDNVAEARRMPPDVPYLVIHGAADTYIQPEHAREVYAAAASRQKELWMVPGADHADEPFTDPQAYQEQVTCWVDGSCIPAAD